MESLTSLEQLLFSPQKPQKRTHEECYTEKSTKCYNNTYNSLSTVSLVTSTPELFATAWMVLQKKEFSDTNYNMNIYLSPDIKRLIMNMVFSFIVFSSCLLQKHIKKEDNLECEDCVRIMCKDNKVRTKEPNQTSHMTHFTCSGIVGVSGHLDRGKTVLWE